WNQIIGPACKARVKLLVDLRQVSAHEYINVAYNLETVALIGSSRPEVFKEPPNSGQIGNVARADEQQMNRLGRRRRGAISGRDKGFIDRRQRKNMLLITYQLLEELKIVHRAMDELADVQFG